MVGVHTCGRRIAAAEFLNRPADNKFETSIVMQNRKAVCSSSLNFSKSEVITKKVTRCSDVGHVKIKMI